MNEIKTVMKTLLTLVVLLVVSFRAYAKELINPLMTSDTVVWAGLDYSLVRMTGADKPGILFNFTEPKIVFQGMFEKWNQLFLDERIEGVSAVLEKQVTVDIAGVTERNKSATTNQIVLISNTKEIVQVPMITPQDIANEVRSLKLDNTNGLGLVFIVERLVRIFYQPANLSHGSDVQQIRNGGGGAVYVVFFDVATREVISTRREVNYISTGGNFRNYWFGPIKGADETLGRYRTSKTSKSYSPRLKGTK